MISVNDDYVNIDSNDIYKDMFQLLKTLEKHGFNLPLFMGKYYSGVLNKIYDATSTNHIVSALYYKNNLYFLGGNNE